VSFFRKLSNGLRLRGDNQQQHDNSEKKQQCNRQQQEFILGQHIVNNLLFDFTVALCIANEHMAIAVASLLFLGDCEILRQH
jgi:hypothetical protein